MKFRKEDRIYIILTILIDISLVVSIFLVYIYLYPVIDEYPQYKDIVHTVMTLGYGTALFFACVLNGFFIYLRFCTDEKGNSYGDQIL